MSLLSQLKEDIISNDKESLVRDLENFQLEKLTTEEFIQTLEVLFSYCLEDDKQELIDPIYESFKERNIKENNLPLINEFFMYTELEDEELKIICDNISTFSVLDFLIGFTEYDDNEYVGIALENLDYIIQDEDISLYRTVLNFAKKRDRQHLKEYCLRKIKEFNIIAPIPSWIKKVSSIKMKEKVRIIFTEEEWIDETIKFMKEVQGIVFEDEEKTRNALSLFYKSEDISKFERFSSKNEEVNFNIEGPINRRERYSGICNGECKMLTCRCRVEVPYQLRDYKDELSDEEKEDWFNLYEQKCIECSKKILKKNYAFRFPLNDGGWTGCYCSTECAEKYNTQRIFENLKPGVNNEKIIKSFIDEIKATEEGEEITVAEEIFEIGLPIDELNGIVLAIKRIQYYREELDEKFIYDTED